MSSTSRWPLASAAMEEIYSAGMSSLFRTAWRAVRAVLPQGSSAARRAAVEERLRTAQHELAGVQRSQETIPEVHDTVTKLTAAELFRTKTGPELRQLANYCYHGIGTDQNERLASGLWAQGAAKGDLECMYSLAQCLLQGRGIVQDVYGGPNEDGAMKVLEDILRQVPHGWSMYSLGNILFRRFKDDRSKKGMAQRKRAQELYLAAAKQGVSPACLNVANFLLHGLAGDKDVPRGLQWLRHAARTGDPIAQVTLAQKLAEGKDLPQDMTRSVRLWEKLAERGRPVALHNVGAAHLVGEGAEQSDAKAAEFFAKSASLGFAPAKINLAMLYEQGRGVPQDFDKALELLREVEGEGFDEEVADTIRYVERRRVCVMNT